MNGRWPARPNGRSWPPLTDWRRAYALDLRHVRDATLTDGALTLDGRAWTTRNTAYGGAQLVGGVGLQLSPSAGAHFDTSAPTAPMLDVVLGELIPQLHKADRVRVQVAVGDANLSEAGQGFGVVIGHGAATSYVTTHGPYHNGEGLKVRTQRIRTTGAVLDVTPAATPTFLSVEWSPSTVATGFSTGDAWPTPGTEALGSRNTNLDAMAIGDPDGWYGPDKDRLRLFATRPTGASAFTATFLGLRVWVQRR